VRNRYLLLVRKFLVIKKTSQTQAFDSTLDQS